MSTTTVRQNIIYALGEGASVANTTMLTYALRWANDAYRDMFSRVRFKNLRTRAVFRTNDGQATYQAPNDLIGFLVLKDETNSTILDQVTVEEFNRDITSTQVTDESFTSSFDTAVALDYQGIVQYSETVTNTAGTTTYTRDSDYTISNTNGTITVLSTGIMSDATEYEIDYLYRPDGPPKQFCIEYDATNTKWVFRFDPVPDDTYIMTILYAATPSALAATTNPLWSSFEFCIERGGIYYGSLEVIDDQGKRQEFRQNYEMALQALIQLDSDLVPKQQQIPVIMKRRDMRNDNA